MLPKYIYNIRQTYKVLFSQTFKEKINQIINFNTKTTVRLYYTHWLKKHQQKVIPHQTDTNCLILLYTLSLTKKTHTTVAFHTNFKVSRTILKNNIAENHYNTLFSSLLHWSINPQNRTIYFISNNQLFLQLVNN